MNFTINLQCKNSMMSDCFQNGMIEAVVFLTAVVEDLAVSCVVKLLV
jgi:hypothetical protein